MPAVESSFTKIAPTFPFAIKAGQQKVASEMYKRHYKRKRHDSRL